MKQKVYVETSIASFYFETKKSDEATLRKKWTQKWWNNYLDQFDVVTSLAVINELKACASPKREQCIELLDPIPFVELTEQVSTIVETYIAHKIMPKDPSGDALHLALASYHKCDILLTWNCKHLANVRKIEHIRLINSSLGLYNPILSTPLEFFEEGE